MGYTTEHRGRRPKVFVPGTGQCREYNNTGMFNGRGIKYALQFSVHAGIY